MQNGARAASDERRSRRDLKMAGGYVFERGRRLRAAWRRLHLALFGAPRGVPAVCVSSDCPSCRNAPLGRARARIRERDSDVAKVVVVVRETLWLEAFAGRAIFRDRRQMRNVSCGGRPRSNPARFEITRRLTYSCIYLWKRPISARLTSAAPIVRDQSLTAAPYR